MSSVPMAEMVSVQSAVPVANTKQGRTGRTKNQRPSGTRTGGNHVSEAPKHTPTYTPSHTMSVSSSESEQSSKILVNDDLRRELGKHDIQVDKWYHKLLTGQYFNASGMCYYESDGCWGNGVSRTNTMFSTMEVSNEIPILKKLAMEYQRSLSNKNIANLVLLRNELFNHLPEQLWIHNYLMGDVYDANGTPLNCINPDIERLSKQYNDIYQSSLQNCAG